MPSKLDISPRFSIDEIRAAVIGYLAAGPYMLTKYDTESLIDATLRKTVEKVGTTSCLPSTNYGKGY